MRIDLKIIKKGDVFWECDSGNNAKMRALTDAYEVNNEQRNGWEIEVEALEVNGKEVDAKSPWHEPYTLFEAYETHGYGLKLYRDNAYVSAHS